MFRTLAVLTLALLGATAASAPARADRTDSIPDRAMLQPADLGGMQPGPVEPDTVHPLLPQPCADTPVPLPVVSRSLTADLGPRLRVYENVARYPRGGAQEYLTVLKEQLVRCDVSGFEEGFDRVAEDHMGPHTALFLHTYDANGRYAAYVAAAVGNYVIVVIVVDPLVGGGDLTRANGLASAAIRRASEAGC